MKSDITNVIAELVLESDSDLATRLEYQAEALRTTECTNPVIGQWVDENDVKYLLSTFALGDKDFAARFPAMGYITAPERQRVIAAIEAHCNDCPHCSLKRGYDMELDARIKQACQQNNSALLQLLKDEMAETSEESENQGLTPEKALSTP
jgi:hypothetical protein